jgi:CubicO group peptidase (beta-lactamase class C family)
MAEIENGWLTAALDYLPRWLEFQMQTNRQPGCAIAVAHRGAVVFERAFGSADLTRGEALTPRHRFRVASHSKTFTAVGIMKLREAGRLRLDDPVGDYVEGLHPKVAGASLAQLLSHSAGLVRDGADSGQWQMRRPFLSRAELMAELAEAPVLPGSTRLKYSNHGYALLGLVIEAVTGEPYADWTAREVIAAAGLAETQPDGPPAEGVPFAHGHSRWELLGERLVMPADVSAGTMAAAGGFLSTAADLARFYAQLDPAAERSLLSAASRREMVRALWPDPHSSIKRSYGLGMILGSAGDWSLAGHSGSFPGTLSCSFALLDRELSVSILTNALDGLANLWIGGAVQVLRAFAAHGEPSEATRSWQGRWWSFWGPLDLVAFGDQVKVAAPGLVDPFLDAAEIEVSETDRDRGTIRLAGGFASHGEPARLVRRADGAVAEVWLGGAQLVGGEDMAAELRRTCAPV